MSKDLLFQGPINQKIKIKLKTTSNLAQTTTTNTRATTNSNVQRRVTSSSFSERNLLSCRPISKTTQLLFLKFCLAKTSQLRTD